MKQTLLSAITLFGLLGPALDGTAQIINPARKVKEKGEERANDRIDQTIDKGFDKLDEGLDGLFGSGRKIKQQESAQKGAHPEAQGVYPTDNPGHASGVSTDFSQYRGSAFVPGKEVLLFEDFTTAHLGTGPGNWHLYEYDDHVDAERPNIRSISLATGNWLKMPRKGFIFPHSFKALPEQCTIEFDMYADPEKMSEMEGGLRTNFVAKDDREAYSIYWSTEPAIGLDVHPHGRSEVVNIQAKAAYNSALNTEDMVRFDKTFTSGWQPGTVNRVAICRNGTQVVLYLNGKEMVNLVHGLPQKATYNLLFSTNLNGDGIFITNMRIAGTPSDPAREMETEGKFVTNAIYFDVNSARIKPESWAVLQQVADAIGLAAGDILIVGHTDSDGADGDNIMLAQKRAASVKMALVREFNIPASRLKSDGRGESEPVAPEHTASGKAKNRRVEFIRQ